MSAWKPLATKAYWDGQWDGVSLPQRVDTTSPATGELHEKLKERLPRGRLRALEVGTAPAQWLHYFWKEFGYDTFGLDYSQPGCLLSKRNLHLLHSPGEIISADIFHPPFKEESFDLVFSMGVMEHFESMEPILRKCIDLLKPGGYLLTVIPNMLGLPGILQKLASETTLKKHRRITIREFRRDHSTLNDLLVSHFGPFNLSVVNWPKASKIRDAMLFQIQRFIWTIMNILRSPPNSRLTSSHLMALGRKPE